MLHSVVAGIGKASIPIGTASIMGAEMDTSVLGLLVDWIEVDNSMDSDADCSSD